MSEALEFAPGNWDFVSSEGFDEYMKAVGVGMATRLIARALKPTNEISLADDVWTLKTVSTFKNNEIIFKIGEEIEENTPDGRKLKTIFTIDGNKLIQSQKGEVDSVITRTFTKDTLLITLEANGVVCTRHYQRRP